MTLAVQLLVLSMLFAQGCAERFDVTGTVHIGMGKGRLGFVCLAGQEIALVTDFWIYENHLYGYRYHGSEYDLFLIDLKTDRVFEGTDAWRIVCEKGMPIDRWTNAVELFGDFIADRGRRDLFIKAAQEAGLKGKGK